MTEPWFDPKISFGLLIHLFGSIVTLVGVYWKMRELVFKLHTDNLARLAEVAASVKTMEAKVESLWDWFTNHLERRHLN